MTTRWVRLLTTMIIALVVITGCSVTDEATVVDIQDDDRCHVGKLTMLDTSRWGRIKRCGVWGTVGETFLFNYYEG